jgi:hypothetical protein
MKREPDRRYRLRRDTARQTRSDGAEFAEKTDGAGTAYAVAHFRCAVTDDVVAPGTNKRGQKSAGSPRILFHDWEIGQQEGWDVQRKANAPTGVGRRGSVPKCNLGTREDGGGLRNVKPVTSDE